jgi:pyridoxamine 5'-phosphate oxidase family protein
VAPGTILTRLPSGALIRGLTYGRSVGTVAGVVEVAIVLVAAYLIYTTITDSTRRRSRQLPAGGRWRPNHYADDGHTVVTVARMTAKGEVIEEHVVARFLDTDDEWSRKFLEAKQEAEERAFHLNAGNPA